MREGQELLEALDVSDRDVFLVVLRLQLSSSSRGSVFPSKLVSASLGRVCFEGLATWLLPVLDLKLFETTTLFFLPVSIVLLLPGILTKLYLCSVLDLLLVFCLLPFVVFNASITNCRFYTNLLLCLRTYWVFHGFHYWDSRFRK